MEQIKNALDIRIDTSYNSYDEIIKVVKRKKLIRDIEYDSSSEKNNKK